MILMLILILEVISRNPATNFMGAGCTEAQIIFGGEVKSQSKDK